MARRKNDPLSKLIAPARTDLRRAAVIDVLASLLWLAQAAAASAGIAEALVPGQGIAPATAALGFFGIGALRAGLSYVSGAMVFNAGDRVSADLRERIIAREAQDGPGLGASGAGATAALASEKVDALLPYITRYAPAQARVMVVPLAILLLALPMSWAVGVIFLFSGPLIPVFMALIGMAAQAASERQMSQIGTLNDLLADRLAALADFRLLGARTALIDGFARESNALHRHSMATLRIAFLSSTVLELFAALGVAFVAVFLGFSLLGQLNFGTWGTPLTPFQVIFLLMLTPDFYQPLRDLATAWHDRAAAAAVAGEIEAWEAAPRAPSLGTGAPAPALLTPMPLETKSLVLTRGETRVALPDMRIEAGRSLALTGPSGSGKTSALMALAGLIAPAEGDVLIAGEKLTADNADQWRACLGWMPQAPQFLDASLRENIALSHDAPVEPALERASVAHVVAALPDGLETRLGESGAGLSGGEARRVTLARALHAAPALLLADEPTADLDAETAALVTDALVAAAARGTAVVVATHDPVLAERMDTALPLGDAA